MRLYIYSKCSTCQEALRYLNSRKIVFEKREITETPPSVAELKEMLAHAGGKIQKLFNTSGMLYRELGLSEKLKTMSEEAALSLLSQNGMLVKRPFLLGNGVGITGFNTSVWDKLL